MKYADLKNRDAGALQKVLLDCKKELMALRFQRATGSEVNSSKFRLTKKTIARIKTLQTMIRKSS